MEGSYEILGVIGRSGLGTLYRARYQGTGAFTKLVTLKRLDEGVADTDEVACRLRDEARMLGFLEHRAIVRVDNLVRLDGRWTLVLEHVDGVSLEEIIERGPVPTGPALEIVGTVAGALHAAYTTQGPDGSPLRIQHRDVKPSGVLIDAYGAPRVTDFGIARACFAGREARTRSFVVGSFEYMAPERLALEEGGPWSDIYSLGQVFYALLTGHSFGRSHPSERHHKSIIDKAMGKLLGRPGGVDEGALELLGRMLALEPHERPDARSVERSCHQLVRGLEDETLRAWAEQAVEPMIAARNASSQGGLVGRFLREGEADSPAPRPPSVPDPSLVTVQRPDGEPDGEPGSKPAAEPMNRPSARRELEPMPEFVASRDDDEATEIMVRPEAGGEGPLDDEEQDSDATEMFTVSSAAARFMLAEEPRSRPPVATVEELYESVTSVDVDEPELAPIDLSTTSDEAPVFRSQPTSSPEPLDAEPPPADEPPSWNDDSASGLEPERPTASYDLEVSEEDELDLARPTIVQEPEVSEQDELDLARPTVVQDPGEVTGDPAMVGRPTAISWFSDEVRPEIPQQGVGEVTAVTPSEVSDELFPAFSLPAGSLDEQTAVGPDLETARAERSEMAQVRFDMPVAAQDDRTLECDEAGLVREERPQDVQVRFELPAGTFDEHTALGEDIEAARAGQDAEPQARFELPAGTFDEHTALGEDIEAARADRSGPGAAPRVHFDTPQTTAAPAPQPPLPPALDMPSGPPPPAEPLPPAPAAFAPSAHEPQPIVTAALPPMPDQLVPPPPTAEPPLEESPPAEPPLEEPPPAEPPFEEPPADHAPPEEPPADHASPEPGGGLPLPPPPPPPTPLGPGGLVGEVEDRPTHSQARAWTPGVDQSSSHDRPQLDFWEPPSLASVVEPADEPPAPGPPPLPEHASPAVEVQVEDDPVAVEVQMEAEAAPTPRPHAPAPEPTQGVDTTVARGDQPAVAEAPLAPVADDSVPAPKRKSKLLLVMLGLVVLGVLGVALLVALGAVWYFLIY